MKKILALLVCAVLTSVCAVASEGFGLGVWFDYPEELKGANIDGVGIGLPVLNCGDFSGAALALCGNVTGKTSGFQGVLIGFNKAATLDGAQIAFVNLHDGVDGDFGLQIGFYNQSGKQGVQLGLLNNSRDNATFQLGLVNINKGGWLPVMIFVNFCNAYGQELKESVK